ncbi:MAG: hypothetical protein IT258_15170 [Saprospiraceae bacterium]|nr:hypothetical protein [Saprospiraceae bacterium]
MEKNDPNNRIDEWLSGKMTPEAAVAFEREMTADPALAEAVAVERELRAALNLLAEDDLREQMKGMEQDWRRTGGDTAKPTNGKQPFWKWGLGLLVLVAVGYAAFLYFGENGVPEMPAVPSTPNQSSKEAPQLDTSPVPSSSQPETPKAPDKQKLPQAQPTNLVPIAEQFAPMPTLDGLRSATNDPNDKNELSEAVAAFDKKDYRQVVALLAQPTGDWATDALWLRGHARFRLRQFRMAATDFDLLAMKKSLRYGEEAEWMLLLCELAQSPKQQHRIEARLKALESDSGHAYHDNALELRKAITQMNSGF